jgi:hypothetical protein
MLSIPVAGMFSPLVAVIHARKEGQHSHAVKQRCNVRLARDQPKHHPSIRRTSLLVATAVEAPSSPYQLSMVITILDNDDRREL